MSDYTPFKMKAHGSTPMKKNFGIGDSEQPIKTAPVKMADDAGESPLNFFGAFKRMREKMKAKAAAKRGAPTAEAASAAATDPAEAEMQAQAADPAGDPEAAGGEVPQHGPEAHTGGAGPQGKGGPGGMMGKMMKKMRPMGGGGRGVFGNLFSDVRLKEKIEKTGVSASGIPIYEFNYIGCSNRYSGAMAQDLLSINPDAVSLDSSGYYKVNYNDIDVDMHLINN